jgi:hypothetical protein
MPTYYLDNKVSIDGNTKYFLFCLFIALFFLDNSIYFVFGSGLIAFVLNKLYYSYKPTIFILLFLYHFVQIISGIILVDFLDIDISYRTQLLGTATIFSFLGLIALIIPIIYFQKKIPTLTFQQIKMFSQNLSVKRTFELYVAMFFIVNLLSIIAFQYEGLTQIIFSFRNIKWFIFLLLGFQVIIKNELKIHFIVIVVIEFLLGLLSFFSDFKTITFYLFILLIFFVTKVNFKQVLILLFSLIILLFLGIKWTSVKGEYRSYLNKGTQTQTVRVEQNQAFDKLMELSDKETDFNKSAAQFFDRIQYTFHLAKTMERIPSVLPYENGGNISSILSYVTTPRYFNPNKEFIKTSAKATKYTGIAYLGSESGVSFSLGYFADCFIDFGYIGMLFPLLALGFIYGLSYFYFATKSTNNLLINFALVGALYMEFIPFETDGVYLMGRLFSNLLTFYLFKQFLLPWVYNYIKVNNNTTKF